MPGLTDPCAYCDYYAGLERAGDEAVLPTAEIARLDAIGQRWAEIGRTVLAAPGTPCRPLAEITADALHANCGAGDCWAEPGRPCSCAPGTHLARYARARRKGLLSGADMSVVLDAAGDVFEPSTVIYAEAAVTT